jgi:hypothetical protein
LSGFDVRLWRPVLSADLSGHGVSILSGCPALELEKRPFQWDGAHMTKDLLARQVDDRRRLVLPDTCPPGSMVLIQQIDADTWVVKRQKPEPGLVIVALRDVQHLPDDPEWEKTEARIGRHISRRIPEPQE